MVLVRLSLGDDRVLCRNHSQSFSTVENNILKFIDGDKNEFRRRKRGRGLSEIIGEPIWLPAEVRVKKRGSVSVSEVWLFYLYQNTIFKCLWVVICQKVMILRH